MRSCLRIVPTRLPVTKALEYITGAAVSKIADAPCREANACLRQGSCADRLESRQKTRKDQDIMLDWLSETAGPGYASALLWTLGALLLLVVVLVGIRVFKSLTFGTYVAGGRHRRH